MDISRRVVWLCSHTCAVTRVVVMTAQMGMSSALVKKAATCIRAAQNIVYGAPPPWPYRAGPVYIAGLAAAGSWEQQFSSAWYAVRLAIYEPCPGRRLSSGGFFGSAARTSTTGMRRLSTGAADETANRPACEKLHCQTPTSLLRERVNGLCLQCECHQRAACPDPACVRCFAFCHLPFACACCCC